MTTGAVDTLLIGIYEHITQMAYRARFSQRDKLPALHSTACPKARFVNSQPKQTAGFHESGDALRDVDFITSAKAY